MNPSLFDCVRFVCILLCVCSWSEISICLFDCVLHIINKRSLIVYCTEKQDGTVLSLV